MGRGGGCSFIAHTAVMFDVAGREECEHSTNHDMQL